MRKRRMVGLIGVTLLATVVTHSCGAEPSKVDPAALQRWQDMRFGMFIHWGPVSLTGREIGWSRGRETPIAEYDRLHKRFNPEQFNADAWVLTAKAAGMKYMVITTKHHDGFCIWPSAFTDHDIGESPFKRDPLKELSEACKRHGIRFGTYYSTCDWHHPDFTRGSPGGKTKNPNPNLGRYTEYLRNQVRELVQNYGPLSTLWFDVPQDVGPELGKPTVAMLRKLQPDIIINNRAYRDKGGPVGDYDTPEQRVGGFNRDRPWETCMTICRQWAWKPNDAMKPLKQCVQTLLQVAGGDGNFLFNVGPMPDGRIEPRQVERLKKMGAWVSKYGNAIYGTRGGPFKPGKWGAATCKGSTITLFVMTWPEGRPLTLPPVDMTITSSKVLSGGTATVEQTDEGVTVMVPVEHRDEIATVIELTVDGQAFDIPPVNVVHRSNSLSYSAKAKASNVYKKMAAQYGPAKALDDDESTRWATDTGTSEAWIEVNLGKPREITRVRINEPKEYARVKSFELQHRDGEAWKTFHEGTTIGPNWTQSITPITAQHVRLSILEATDGPTIWEFQLFAK